MSTITVTPVTEFAAIKKLAETGDLWIINNTDYNNSRPRGLISFSVKDVSGDVTPVVIPATWVPINMASYCEPINAVNSQQFRDSISKQAVLVISSEDAKEMLSSSQAREELAEVEQFRRGNREAINQRPTSVTGTVSINIGSGGGHATLNQPLQPEISQGDASSADDTKVDKLVQDFNNNRLSDNEAVALLEQLNPSIDALKKYSGNVTNTGSKFFFALGDAISEMS